MAMNTIFAPQYGTDWDKEPLFFDYFIIGDEDMDMELQAILKPYDKWDNDVDEETNLRAKEALHDFYKTLLKR